MHGSHLGAPKTNHSLNNMNKINMPSIFKLAATLLDGNATKDMQMEMDNEGTASKEHVEDLIQK